MDRLAGELMAVLLFGLFFQGAHTALSQEDAGKTPLTSHVDPARGILEWSFKGHKLLSYAFASNQFKPYVRELYTLAGDNVLHDSPPDHLHHHGLMYAIRINGINFWEEVGQAGHERHVKLVKQETDRTRNGLPRASFTELVHWVADGDHTLPDTTSVALLIEQRTLTLTVDEAKGEVALAWHADFEVGPRTNHIKVHGSDYNGLGLRLPQAWEQVARHENSENAPYLTDGKRDLVRARWSAVSHGAGGRTMQVILCARPNGHAGTNLFFSMLHPFTYLSATQGLDLTPLEYNAGDRFGLDYLVLVYAQAGNSARIEQRFQNWAKELTLNR